MSKSEEHTILDLMDDGEQPSHNWLNYLSLGLLALGVLLNYLHYEFDKPVLIAAFAGMLTYGSLHFFRKKRAPYAWFYFLGRLVLTAGIILFLFRMPASRYAIVAACALFAFGVIFSKKSEENEPIDPAQKEEEDLLM